MGNKVDIWTWTDEDRKLFREEGGAKKAIIDNYEEFWRCYDDDPIGADLAIHNAIDSAQSIGEKRWELHLRHWRLQNWLRQSQVKRMLPEAIDLLDLALDERVKDVPQRICAYHDVVECYVQIDPAGYYQEIKENSEHILSQLPKRYPCADCARSNLARAAAAAGKVEEAEHWLAEHESNRHDDLRPSIWSGRGQTYTYLRQWENAEKAYQEASRLASKEQDRIRYLWALLGIARTRIGKGDLQGAQNILPHIRQQARYESGPDLVARLLEIEGYVAELHKVPQAALDYLTSAAKINDELGCYREAADLALHAAELAREQKLPEPSEALEIAARAIGLLPPTSQDLYQRLTALGRDPLLPTSEQNEPFSSSETAEQLKEAEIQKERASIEEVFQAHLRSGNFHGITTALFRLGIWHDTHNQARAAVDYFIWSAALERLHRFPGEEREDALNALKHMSTKLPEGTVAAALRAAESAPPTQLLPMLANLPTAQWQWTLQAIANEISDKPVVEPEPQSRDKHEQFEQWIEHCASMTALIVRFCEQADPAKCEAWAVSLEQNAQAMEDQLGEHKDEPGAMVVPSFARGLAALSRGESIEAVGQRVLPPFNQVIVKIQKVAEQPVWRHPESTPIDFLVEQAAQKAVRALRNHDDHRDSRLANLAFRYELMTIDLRKHQELESMAGFLDALAALVQNGGQQLPASEPPLEEPYAAILAAVYQATQEEEDENEK